MVGIVQVEVSRECASQRNTWYAVDAKKPARRGFWDLIPGTAVVVSVNSLRNDQRMLWEKAVGVL